jgi:hypothetical protein
LICFFQGFDIKSSIHNVLTNKYAPNKHSLRKEYHKMEEEHTGHSRLFAILAIALIGLLVLGLLGIGGVFVIRQNLQGQAVLSQSTPTLMIELPNPTATFTPIKLAATNTPQPTPTSTPVLAAGGAGGEEAAVSSTDGTNRGNGQAAQGIPLSQSNPNREPVSGAAEAALPEEVPETGLGALEAVLIAAGLVTVLFVTRRMRMSL